MAITVTSIPSAQYRDLLKYGENSAFGDPEQFASAARFVEREWGESGYRMAHVAHGIFLVRHGDGSRFLIRSDRYGNTSVVQGPDAGQSRRRRAPAKRSTLTSITRRRRTRR